MTPTRRSQWECSMICGGNEKDRHGKHCHEQRKYFSHFILSVDSMLGKEALFVLVNLSRLMAEKWRNPFRTCEAGLSVRFQSRSRDRTPI